MPMQEGSLARKPVPQAELARAADLQIGRRVKRPTVSHVESAHILSTPVATSCESTHAVELMRKFSIHGLWLVRLPGKSHTLIITWPCPDQTRRPC